MAESKNPVSDFLGVYYIGLGRLICLESSRTSGVSDK